MLISSSYPWDTKKFQEKDHKSVSNPGKENVKKAAANMTNYKALHQNESKYSKYSVIEAVVRIERTMQKHFYTWK